MLRGIESNPSEQSRVSVATERQSAPTPVYRVEGRNGYGPCGPEMPDSLTDDARFLELRRMMEDGHKSAFRSREALLCYFWLSLADLHARGYLAALYVAPVLKEDHTGQCLIPVDAQPLRRVPLLDLALLAGEGE